MRKNPPTLSGVTAGTANNQLVNDGNAHGAASTSNLALGSLEGVNVQVGQLGLSDLGDLSLGNSANLGLVGNAGTLVQTDCFHDQQGGSEGSW